MSAQQPNRTPRTVQVDEIFLVQFSEILRYADSHEHGGDWQNAVADLLQAARGFMSPEVRELEDTDMEDEDAYENKRELLFPNGK